MIEDVRRFILAVDLLSFTKAAEALHITQPALSLSIQRLEKTTNTTLFQPTPRRLSLTSDGKLMYDMGKRLVLLWDNLKDPKVRQKFLGKKHYILGAFDNAALKLAPFFKIMSEESPISLEIIIDNSKSLRKQLFFGLLNICICVLSRQEVGDPTNAILKMTYEESLLPVSAKIWKKTPFFNLPFILYQQDSTTREYLDDFFLQKKIKPHIVAESTSTSFMKELAMQGLGVAFLPENVVAQEISEKKLFVMPTGVPITRNVGVYTARENNELVEKEILPLLGEYLK